MGQLGRNPGLIEEWIQNKVSSKNRGAKKLGGGGRNIVGKYGIRENAFGMDNFTNINELRSVTETCSKEIQDICRGKHC